MPKFGCPYNLRFMEKYKGHACAKPWPIHVHPIKIQYIPKNDY